MCVVLAEKPGEDFQVHTWEILNGLLGGPGFKFRRPDQRNAHISLTVNRAGGGNYRRTPK
jgi:hypothetical protein